MISLFGFILAIGIVVDNAIVVSENIYTNSEKGMPAMQATVKGTQRIAIPVVFFRAHYNSSVLAPDATARRLG
jgi:multidrug efflux pump subunit AcrB